MQIGYDDNDEMTPKKGYPPNLSSMQKRCKFIKPDGQSCKAWAMADSEFCYFHNPEISDKEKKATQSRGGQANKIKILEPLEPLTLKKGDDVVLLLQDTINRIRAGEMDLKVANCIGYLVGYLIKAIEIAKLEDRDRHSKELFGDLF